MSAPIQGCAHCIFYPLHNPKTRIPYANIKRMKRLYIYGLLGLGVYSMLAGGSGVVKDLFGSNAAQLVGSFTESELKRKIIDEYAKTILTSTTELTVDAIKTTITDLNEDGRKDVVATIESGTTCGGGGCIASIFLVNEQGELTPIPFGIAVKHIEVLGSSTNGMHDLRINHDEANRMIWDGAQYVLEKI